MGLIGGTQLASQVANIELIKAQTENVKADTERKLGKEMAISNTSGVALQVAMLPLIEKVQQKRALTAQCLREVK